MKWILHPGQQAYVGVARIMKAGLVILTRFYEFIARKLLLALALGDLQRHLDALQRKRSVTKSEIPGDTNLLMH